MRFSDLVIEASPGPMERGSADRPIGRFTVRVLSSPAGEMRVDQAVPVSYDDRQLQSSLRQLEARALDRAALIDLGRTLAQLLFPPTPGGATIGVRELVAASLARLAPDDGLRLRLRLPPQLAALPWEYVYLDRAADDSSLGGFLALDPRVAIVRHEVLSTPGPLARIDGQLKLVAALASPPDLPALDLAREQSDLQRALQGLDGIAPALLPHATLDELLKTIQGAQIFHFAGHATFNQYRGDNSSTYTGAGSLALDDRVVSAEQLAINLRACGLRLVVLAGDETGRRDGVSVWSGIAPALAQAGIPAIVAYQFSIKDTCATAFARQFYAALAARQSVDEAVAAGRQSAYQADPDGRDWGVPALYLSSYDGYLFGRPAEPAPHAGMPGTVEGTPTDERAAVTITVQPAEQGFQASVQFSRSGPVTTATHHLPVSAATLQQMTARLRKELDEIVYYTGASGDRPFLGENKAIDPALSRQLYAKLAAAGQQIHAALFEGTAAPAGQATLAGDLRALADGSSIRVVLESRDFILPWALVYDKPGPISPETLDWAGFWGYRYLIDVVPPGQYPRPEIDDNGMSIQMLFGDDEPLRPYVDQQEQLVRSAFPRAKPSVAVGADEALKALHQLDDAALVYFYCVGNQSALQFSRGQKLALADLRGLQIPRLARQPLVFLNMCDSAAARDKDSYIFYFIEELGARGFIGTEANTPVVQASDFARQFMQEFSQCRPAAEILWQLRRDYLDQYANILAFNYSFYGLGETRLVRSASALPLSPADALARIRLVQANLLDLEVDALVHAVGLEPARAGYLGEQLIRRIGPRLREELERRRHLAPGEAMVTDAAPLHARYLIHVTNEDRQAHHTLDSNVLAVDTALRQAEALGDVRSIGLPAIGAGAAGLDPAEAAPRILAAALAHLERGGKVEQVVFAFAEERVYQAYAAAYQALAGSIERDSVTIWYLSLASLKGPQIKAGESLQLTLSLGATRQPGSVELRVPASAPGLAVSVEAPGFLLRGEPTRTIALLSDSPPEHSSAFDLTAQASGEHSVRVLVYPGERAAGSSAIELKLPFTVLAPSLPPLSSAEALARIQLVQANLLDLEVDALVNPTSPQLDLSGSIGQQLIGRIGYELRSQLRVQPAPKLGEAVVTGAGTLPARYLVHAPVREGEVATLETVVQGAAAALASAEALADVRSIGLPAIGTGAAGLEPTETAPRILAAALTHLEHGSRLERVVFAFAEERVYQAYVAAYQSLAGPAEPPAERVPVSSWYLGLAAPQGAQIGVGEAIQLTLSLSPTPQPGGVALRVPVSTLELTVYIKAPGFQVAGRNARTIAVVNGSPVERSIMFDLTALSSGERSARVLVYPGGRVAGISPAELELPIRVIAPRVLPPIPELIDRREIPDPQPQVMLYVALEETPDGEQVQLYLTCPALRLDRAQLSPPLALTCQDLAALRLAAIEAAADAADAPPQDALASLRAFGALLFDQLMPPGHPLRRHYWQILRLAALSETIWSWLIVADDQAILPWELVCPYARTAADELWYDDFLAGKFVLAHWVGRQGLRLADEAPLGQLDLIHYRQRAVDLARWHAAVGGETYAQVEDQAGYTALTQPGSPYYGLHMLRVTEPRQAGRVTFAGDEPAGARAADGTPDAMIHEQRLDFTLRRPVIGLSFVDGQAPGAGLADRDTAIEAGWALPFMHAGASALFGPRWPVPPEVDQVFARAFYQAMRAGTALGWAIWIARDHVRQAFPHRPDWLAYTYFGHPWCAPYLVRPAQGFTLFEAIDHAEGQPYQPGARYRFRASYRSEAPVWYGGRLRALRAPLQAEALSVMVIPLSGALPQAYPLQPVEASDDYQNIVELTMPAEPTTLSVMVQFQRGDRELRTLVLKLNVGETRAS